MRLLVNIVAGLALFGLISHIGCGPDKDEGPSKDLFRSITPRLAETQDVVRSGDHNRIDSLLVPSLRGKPEGAEALLDFIKGDDSLSQFKGFANYQIFHTKDVARVDADLASSDSLLSRRVTLTFDLIDTTWYLKRWEAGLPPIGSDTSAADEN